MKPQLSIEEIEQLLFQYELKAKEELRQAGYVSHGEVWNCLNDRYDGEFSNWKTAHRHLQMTQKLEALDDWFNEVSKSVGGQVISHNLDAGTLLAGIPMSRPETIMMTYHDWIKLVHIVRPEGEK